MILKHFINVNPDHETSSDNKLSREKISQKTKGKMFRKKKTEWRTYGNDLRADRKSDKESE